MVLSDAEGAVRADVRLIVGGQEVSAQTGDGIREGHHGGVWGVEGPVDWDCGGVGALAGRGADLWVEHGW